jgi:protein TonB
MKPSSYLSSSFLDILFEGRNKAYGAYELRLHYRERLRNAFFTTASLIMLLSLLFSLTLSNNKESPVPPLPDKSLMLSEIKENKPDMPAVAIPKAPAPLKSRIKNAPFKVVKDQLIRPEETAPDLTGIQPKSLSTHTGGGALIGQDPGLSAAGKSGIVAPDHNRKQVFISVEQMPRFPGTTTEDQSYTRLMAFLGSHLQYPAIAQQNDIQGTVVVQFVIGSDGSVLDIHIVGKDPGGGLGAEAIRVISSMPKWIPGRQNGRNVSVQFTLPLRFALK